MAQAVKKIAAKTNDANSGISAAQSGLFKRLAEQWGVSVSHECSATNRLDTRQRLRTTSQVVFPTGTRMPACSARSSTSR